MPTYTAQCKACGHRQDYSASIKHTEKDMPKCEKCQSEMQRVFTGNAGGFILKGEGWFKKGGY